MHEERESTPRHSSAIKTMKTRRKKIRKKESPRPLSCCYFLPDWSTLHRSKRKSEQQGSLSASSARPPTLRPSLTLTLTLLEPQSRFGDKPFYLEVVCPQNGPAVLKGLTYTVAVPPLFSRPTAEWGAGGAYYMPGTFFNIGIITFTFQLYETNLVFFSRDKPVHPVSCIPREVSHRMVLKT